MPVDGPLVELKGIGKTFKTRALMQNRSFTLQGIDLRVNLGEVVGLLGESGSGKSTVANIITMLTPYDEGSYQFKGREIRDFTKRQQLDFKSDVQIIFQDPYGSLNPRATIGSIVREGLAIHKPGLSRAAREDKVRMLLDEVGLGHEQLNKYPHEFSGGQRQRIAIARAMAVEPGLLVCDEPLSSLDVSIQAQVLTLFARLIRDHDLTMLFITHDINVARLLCDRVYVMLDGKIVEQGPTDQVLNKPEAKYTAQLIESVY